MRYRTQRRTCSEAGSIEAHSEPEERAACERYTLHPFALVAGLLPALIIVSAVPSCRLGRSAMMIVEASLSRPCCSF